MKNKLLILIGIFVFVQFGFSLSCFFPYYKIEDGTIMYYGGSNKVMLEKFDIETFEGLDRAFGKDKNHVYFTGKIIEKIDAKTFEIVSRYEPKPIPNSPWGIGCQTSYITEFKDKNGTYKLEDFQSGKLKLKE